MLGMISGDMKLLICMRRVLLGDEGVCRVWVPQRSRGGAWKVGTVAIIDGHYAALHHA